jgi:tRNA pseudouridine55 synthase
LVGEIEQTPPMYSAVKINGRPLYRFARKGREVSRPSRRVKIYELRLIGTSAASARFVVECDAGTYVRVLCEQIGTRVGIPARMGALVRIAAGPFLLKDASLPREIASNPAACMIDPRSVIDLPQVELGSADAARFAHGNVVAVAPAQPTEVIAISAGRIIGTGRFLPDRPGQLTPTRVLI